MTYLPVFLIGFGFGYWFYYARMVWKMRKINKLLNEAQQAIDDAQADMDQTLMTFRSMFGDKQWNEDNL